MSHIQFIARQYDPSLNWRDLGWIRDMWPGKLLVKGVLDVEDGIIAARCGVDGIIVSNHGGRQLDSAPSAITVLPELVDAVGDKLEVLFDSGIESGHACSKLWL